MVMTMMLTLLYIYIYIYILIHGAGSLQMVAASVGHYNHTIEQLCTCLGMVSAAVVIAM